MNKQEFKHNHDILVIDYVVGEDGRYDSAHISLRALKDIKRKGKQFKRK